MSTSKTLKLKAIVNPDGVKMTYCLWNIVVVQSLMSWVCLASNAFGQTYNTPPEKEQGNTLENGQPWQFSGLFIAGFAPFYTIHVGYHYEETFDFYTAGLQIGKVLTDTHGPAWAAGRGEVMAQVLPFWYANVPRQHTTVVSSHGNAENIITVGPESWYGVTVTPLLLRWNFTQLHLGTVMPYVQGGGGLLWTTHDFPFSPRGTTSSINFTPQVAVGTNVFRRETRSVNCDISVIHISSAGLGNYNPGVNVTLQFGIGYSWWKK